MKFVTLVASAALAATSTMAFAQSSNAPGASTMGGQPGQSQTGTPTGTGTATGGAIPNTGGAMNNNMNNNMGAGATTGSSTMPRTNDASKSGAPTADSATKPPGAPTPDTRMNR